MDGYIKVNKVLDIINECEKNSYRELARLIKDLPIKDCTPRKPSGEYDDFGISYYCPNCRGFIHHSYFNSPDQAEEINYCPHCGQPIIWNYEKRMEEKQDTWNIQLDVSAIIQLLTHMANDKMTFTVQYYDDECLLPAITSSNYKEYENTLVIMPKFIISEKTKKRVRTDKYIGYVAIEPNDNDDTNWFGIDIT